MVMESMQGKLASSQFDFGYTEEYYIPGVTSVFSSSCDSVVGDSLEFNQANRGSLLVWLGKRNCSGHNAWDGPHLAARGKSHGFSRLAAGTWGIFSSYGGDVHSKLEIVQ